MKKNLRFWAGLAVLMLIGYSALPAQHSTVPDANDIRVMVESLGFDHSDSPLSTTINNFLKPTSNDAAKTHPVFEASTSPNSLLRVSTSQAVSLLDSIIYTDDNTLYRQDHFYNQSLYRLAVVNQVFDQATGWSNLTQYTYEYDSTGMLVYYTSQQWNTDSSEWENVRRTAYSYNSDGYVDTLVFEIWDSDSNRWSPYRRYIYEYDITNGWVTGILADRYDANAGQWNPSNRYTYSYDNDGRLVLSVSEQWDSAALQWTYFSRYMYTYDTNGNLLHHRYEKWDANAGNWRPDYQYSYQYQNDKLVESLFERYNADSLKLVNSQRTTYNYDNDGNLESYQTDMWDFSTSQWSPYSKLNFTYTNGNMATQTFQLWNSDSSKWINSWRYSFDYNANNLIIEQFNENWDTNNQTWINDRLFTYDYDNNDNLIYYRSQSWSDTAWVDYTGRVTITNSGYYAYIYCSELNAYYSTATGIEEQESGIVSDFALEANYPNPFNPVTTIAYRIGRFTHVKLEVYNTLGQRVAVLVNKKQQPGRYTVPFRGNRLASGVYYYRLITDQFVSTKRMILVK